MSNWRALADEALGADDPRNSRNDRNESPPSVPSVPTVPLFDPARALRAWRTTLGSLDWEKPLHGLDRQRWGQLLGDAHWQLDHFGQQAARDGWSERDLFGVLPGRDGWGGIVDRLRSSRSLVMSGEDALWRRVINGEPESFARGLGDTVQMVPLWEALRG